MLGMLSQMVRLLAAGDLVNDVNNKTFNDKLFAELAKPLANSVLP
jgi:hypothetical protein